MSSKAITYKLIHNRKGQLNDEMETLVQVQAYKDRQHTYISTGVYLKAENWNVVKEQIVKHPDGISEGIRLTARIDEIIKSLKDIEHHGSFNNSSFSVRDLQRQYEHRDHTNFTAFALATLKKEKKLSTATVDKTTRAINRFGTYAKGAIPFGSLNYKLLAGFDHYMQAESMQANSRKKDVSLLAKYAKIAVKEGLLAYDKNPFPDFKIEGTKTNRKALTDEELARLEKLKFTKSNKHLELIRDLFLLQCYTGLRFSDASRLSTTHIYKTGDGLEIVMQATKTAKPVTLPLQLLFPTKGKKDSKPEQLIKKYWREDDKPLFLGNKAQQNMSANNQYTNSELKKIATLAKLQTNLTNHVGRHTFATFLVWRVPLPIVQQLLQHSKVETTMIYITVGSEQVKQHLRKVTDWT